MSKYAIIIDPVSSGAYYAQELIKRGITPLAVLSRYPILSIFSYSFIESDFNKIFIYQDNIEELLASISEYLGQNIPILVLPGAECGIELSDMVSTALCPRSSNGIELSSCRRNKYKMDAILDSVGIRVPAYIKASSVAEVFIWAREHNFIHKGVVIKPLNSGGTDGVIACFNEEEIQTAIESNLGKKNKYGFVNTEILAQEFLLGTEYVIDTVSKRGKHTVTNICQYKKAQKNGSFVYDYYDFLTENGVIQSELAEYTFKVLDGLGIKNGPAHSEVMYIESGPCLIETGARMHGGAGIIPACRLATGKSQLDLTLDLFLENITTPEKNSIGYHLERFTRIVILIPYFDGVVSGLDANLEKIKSLASFKIIKCSVGIGGPLEKTIPGLIVLSHDSFKQLEQDYEKIREFEEDVCLA